MRLVFNIKKIMNELYITEEYKSYFEKNLLIILKQLEEGLELPELLDIIVPDNFGDELLEFQKDKGLQQGFTNCEMAIAMAKMLTYFESGNKHTAIFLNKALVFHIHDDKTLNEMENASEFFQNRDSVINVIHHELIHVQDEYICGEKYLEILNASKECSLDKLLKDITINVWKEYYACRESAETYILNFESDITNIITTSQSMEKNIADTIIEYRQNGNINSIYNELISTSILFTYIAYFQGRICSFSEDDFKIGINEILQKELSGTFIGEKLNNIYENLNEIYGIYPCLEEDSFNSLSETILSCWNNLGIYPESNDNGIYINIPY